MPSTSPSAGGDVHALAVGVANLVIALRATGDWDDADEVTQPQPQRAPVRRRRASSSRCDAWFAALRGEPDAADELLGQLHDLLASEDAQDIG